MAQIVDSPNKASKYKYACGPNEIHPALVGVANNLILFPWSASAGRLYMAGNMIPKSVITSGADERMMVTGFEWKQGYAQTARRIVAPSNMVVEEIFYVGTTKQNSGEKTDAWSKIYVLFKNDEKNAYDVLELPRYNTQNTSVGFEYVYDKEVMRRLERPNATFAKGTVFAQSPRISDSGEWCFGMNTRVAAISSHGTEEDAIWLTESFARDRLKCMFKHERTFQWNEDEYIPLMLYGTDEHPLALPRSGERIRSDGLVMGFRRRISENALVSLTKKALRTPDLLYDVLFYAPTGCEVMSVDVISDRMKNRSNNRGTDYINQPHTDLLDRYEKKQNEMWNNVLRWYNQRIAANRGEDIAITFELETFINNANGNYTKSSTGKTNPLSRAIKRVKLKDWTVNIQLKEIVDGRVKFKFAGLNGDKGVSVKIIPDDHAPVYDDGTRAEVIINNTPAFRRQIFSMLMELSINYINVQIQKEVKVLRNEGKYDEAFAKLLEFYHTGFPEFGEIVEAHTNTPELIRDHVIYCADRQICVHVRSNTRLYGVGIINALREKYSYKPQHATFVNSLGERVRTVNPIIIANQHFMMLDKFGSDMSAQAFPKSNLFGMPAKVNESNKYANWLKDQGNRNTGETEGRLRASQHGGQETSKQLAMAYSPEIRKIATQRIIRAHDVWNINQIVKPHEYASNRAVKMAGGMLSDSGWTVRRELPRDKTFENFPLLNVPITDKGLLELAKDAEDDLIKRDRLTPAVEKRTFNPACQEPDEIEQEMLTSSTDYLEGF